VLRSGLRWPGEQLTPLERRIVREVNGRKTLEEIYAAAKGSYFRFLQAALALAVREVLDIHDVHENVTPPSRELHLADLLVEQAAEEEVLFFRSHRALPLEVLENLCPIWVREPTPHQLALMPEKARAFYRHFDGQTPLGSVLAIDEKERSHQVELLLAQLRDGVLGLLPAPVEKLEEEAERTHEPVTRRWWRRFASGPQGA